MNQLLGCDESHYQSTFVEKSFVICKCSEGFAATDDTYASKKAQARTDGIVFGSYHFADGEDAIEEAKHFLASVGEILEGDLLALDAETGQTAAWCQQFLSYVEAQVGFKPFLYAPVGGWSTALDYPLWVARYGANNGNINLNMPPNIGQWGNWTIWQYSSANNIDLDVFYGTAEQLKAYGQPAPIIAPVPATEAPAAPIEIEPSEAPIVESSISTPETPENATSEPVAPQNDAPQPVVHDGEPIIPVDPNIQALNQAEQDLNGWNVWLVEFPFLKVIINKIQSLWK